jgi:hypothetical protein
VQRSRDQKAQIKVLNAVRKRKALGYAYKLSRLIKALLLEGLSQRGIVARLNELRIPVPSVLATVGSACCAL